MSLNTGLISVWEFVDGSSADLKGSASGIDSGISYSASGASNNGTGEIAIGVGKGLNLSTVSIYMRVRIDVVTTDSYLFSKLIDTDMDNNYAVGYGYGGVGVLFYAAGFSAPQFVASTLGAINDGQLHDICYTYDGTTLKGYLDGSLITTTAPGVAMNTTDGSTFFFSFNGPANPLQRSNSTIARTYIYDRILNLTEVQQLTGGAIYPFGNGGANFFQLLN